MAFYEQFVYERGGLPEDTLGTRMETLRTALLDRICINLPSIEDSAEEILRKHFESRISDRQTKMLSEVTIPSNLLHDELKLLSPYKVVRVNTELFHPMGKPKSCLQLKSVESRLLERADLQDPASKYRSTIWVDVQEKGSLDLTPLKDCAVYVKVYFPFRHSPMVRIQKKLRCAQEIVFLLSQPLTKLRDMIQCECDGFILNEMSEKPVPIPTPRAIDIYPSGCFFIGRTFYNDMRKEGCIDYSKDIIKWLQYNGIGNYDNKDMAETKFEDLKVMLGAPGVYIHQGNCEHIIVVSNVKLLNKHDILKSATYPYVDNVGYNQSVYCDICAVHIAKWLTLDHEKLAYNPAYFCGPCFVSYNYIDGAKCYSFKAYPMQGPVNESEKCLKQFIHTRRLNYDSKYLQKPPRKMSSKSLLGTFFLVDAPGMQTATIYPDSEGSECSTSATHKSTTTAENGIETICIDNTNEEQSTANVMLQNDNSSIQSISSSSEKSDTSLSTHTKSAGKQASTLSADKHSVNNVIKTTDTASTDKSTANNQKTSKSSKKNASDKSTTMNQETSKSSKNNASDECTTMNHKTSESPKKDASGKSTVISQRTLESPKKDASDRSTTISHKTSESSKENASDKTTTMYQKTSECSKKNESAKSTTMNHKTSKSPKKDASDKSTAISQKTSESSKKNASDKSTTMNQKTYKSSKKNASAKSTTKNKEHSDMEVNLNISEEFTRKGNGNGNPLLVVIDTKGEVKVQDIPLTIKDITTFRK